MKRIEVSILLLRFAYNLATELATIDDPVSILLLRFQGDDVIGLFGSVIVVKFQSFS